MITVHACTMIIVHTLRWARSTNAARRIVELIFRYVSSVSLRLEAESPCSAGAVGIRLAIGASGAIVRRNIIPTNSVAVRIASRPYFVNAASYLLQLTCCQLVAVIHAIGLLFGAPSVRLQRSLRRVYVCSTLPRLPARASTASHQKADTSSSSCGDRVGHQVVNGKFVFAALVLPTFAKILLCA